MKVTTNSGFVCEIKESAFDDYRVIKLIAKMESGNEGSQIVAITELITKILGEDQEEQLIEYLENRDGVATMDAMGKELTSIVQAAAENKKKS